MSLSAISHHIEQLSACAASIAELDFVGPQPFTNALLARPDITSLIRDVEVHEKSLFSLSSPAVKSRQTLNSSQPTSSHFASRTPRKTTAVAAVLGRDLHRKVNNAKEVNSASYGRRSTVAPVREELDVHVLLEGAERLSAVYPTVNASEKIATLRTRHQQLADSIAHYEERVQKNSAQLETMHQRRSRSGLEDDDDMDETVPEAPPTTRAPVMTAEDIAQEEQEIRLLEERKKTLEEQVSGMEKDLGVITR